MMMEFRESFVSSVVSSSSLMGQLARLLCVAIMKRQLAKKPQLWNKLTPKYPPGCKRILVSDDYYAALGRNNVALETRPIKEITSNGIRLADEESDNEQPCDLLILATGFRAVDFLHPIQVTGSAGRSLSKLWQERGAPQALYGVTVESMPNFGILFGPNTNLGHNSVLLMIEAQMRYLDVLISAVLWSRNKGSPMTVTPRATRVQQYNDKLQRELALTTFADPSCGSWYKTDEGIITNNWSGDAVSYQKLLSKVHWGDFEISNAWPQKLRDLDVGYVHEMPYLGLKELMVLGMIAMTSGLAARWYMSHVGRRLPSCRRSIVRYMA